MAAYLLIGRKNPQVKLNVKLELMDKANELRSDGHLSHDNMGQVTNEAGQSFEISGTSAPHHRSLFRELLA